jgi:hypothetical protein
LRVVVTEAAWPGGPALEPSGLRLRAAGLTGLRA